MTDEAPEKAPPKLRLALEIGDETEVARVLLGEHPFFEMGPGAPLFGSVFDEGALWRADERGVWNRVEEAYIYQLVQGFSGMSKPTSNGGESPLKVGAGFCKSVLTIVETRTACPGFFHDGAWGVAFRDQFLRIDYDGSARLEPLTAEHRVRFALDFDYSTSAEPIEFMKFLLSIWGNVETSSFDADGLEQVNMLLEWLGYLLSGRTDYQKIFLLIGPPRSGKGTILRLIQRIFGRAASSFKVSKLGDRWTTGMLRGKAVAYDPDVRRSSINDGSESSSVEALLSISGEDQVPIEVKFRDPLPTKLACRLMMATNPPFRITDVGAALSTRLLISQLTRSFLGNEDSQLFERLEKELPGIVRLAVSALQNLSARGRFVEPASSQETRRSIEQSETPMLAFLEDRCEMGDGFQCISGVLYQEFDKWCRETGHRRPSDSTFAETLKRMGIARTRPRENGRSRTYHGIKLLPAERIGAPKNAPQSSS